MKGSLRLRYPKGISYTVEVQEKIMKKTRLTISIVNYNAGDFLLQCLESINKASGEVSLKTVVVDNDSKDDSIKRAKARFPDVEYTLNTENVGFGRAHNQVLKSLDTEYVLILNPDCHLEMGTLDYMIQFMDTYGDVGAASCKLEKEDGSMDIASHRGFPTPWASFKYYFLKDDSLYHLTDRDMNMTHEVDSIVGAFFLTRKTVLEKVGLFDEDYFMYAEDIDLCLRIKQNGFKVMYVPEVKILHHKGISSGLKKETTTKSTIDPKAKLRAFNAFYESMLLFYKKHYDKQYPFFINWLVYLGIHLKWKMAKRKLTV